MTYRRKQACNIGATSLPLAMMWPSGDDTPTAPHGEDHRDPYHGLSGLAAIQGDLSIRRRRGDSTPRRKGRETIQRSRAHLDRAPPARVRPPGEATTSTGDRSPGRL